MRSVAATTLLFCAAWSIATRGMFQLVGAEASLLSSSMSWAGFDANQQPIPRAYSSYSLGSPLAAVQLELFFDVNCPVCKETHATIVRALQSNFSSATELNILLRPFPLPVFRNSMTQTRAAFVVDRLRPGSFATFIDTMFAMQPEFSNDATRTEGWDSVVGRLAQVVTRPPFAVDADAFIQAMQDKSDDDWSARVIWKLGAGKGITTVPAFVANGVPLLIEAFTSTDDYIQAIHAILAS
eukprot:ANDGO_05141.mRNA.1 hypothetical protein H257_00067